MSRIFVIALLSMSITLVSCDKSEDEDPTNTPTPTPPPTPPENPVPIFGAGNGTLTAVNSRTFQSIPFVGKTAVDLGIAVAVFYDGAGSTSFLDAGAVTCEGENLKKDNNNSYVYTPAPTNTVGIDFSGGSAEWEVTGSSSIPTFIASNNSNFPDINAMTSETSIDITKPYTLSTDKAWYSDSIIYMLGGIMHVVASGTLSYTFTAAEVGSLTKGANFAQITGYNWVTVIEDGKEFHLVNETVVTESVTIE